MKKSILLVATLIALSAHAQSGRVGINTENPKATLHIAASADDATTLDGVIPPILTGNQLATKTYTLEQTGTIIYSSAAADVLSGQVINVSSPGYYYFDGLVWQKMISGNEGWLTKGNLGTNEANNYLGTNDDQNLVFRRNGILAGSIRSTETSFGVNSMPLTSTSSGANSAFGFGALKSQITGIYNSAFGAEALTSLTSGLNNASFGGYAGYAITSGQNNTLLGTSAGQALTSSNYNVAVGGSALRNATTGYKNTVIGRLGGKEITTGGYNTLIGQMSGEGLLNNASKNTIIGANAAAFVSGNNNVFIGVLAGRSNTTTVTETVNNRLVIHSNVNSLTPTGAEVVSDLSSSWTNGLIIGDFKDRWVKLNGNLQLNPTYNTSDATYTKTLVAKPDGTVGLADAPMIPTPPAIGSYTLISVNGLMQWVAN